MTSATCSPRRAAALGAAALVILAAAAAGPAWAGTSGGRCASAVDQHLQSLGVAPDAVKQTSLIVDYANLEMGTTRGIEAWTALKSCSGSLVTKLDTSCQVKETYTRGDCRVDRVSGS